MKFAFLNQLSFVLALGRGGGSRFDPPLSLVAGLFQEAVPSFSCLKTDKLNVTNLALTCFIFFLVAFGCFYDGPERLHNA